MKFESPIDEDFFHSSEFSELILSAKKFQMENVKNKINNLNNPENPLMKEIFGEEKYNLKQNITQKIYKDLKNI